MIDTTQLSALISAFRVETEKESISPESVGKLLQDIVDLLATASTGQELQVLDAWKTMLSQYVVVYDVEDANITDPQILFLKIKGLSLRNGSKYTSSVPIAGATDSKAGAMTATHVQSITALQTAVNQLRSSVSSLQNASGQHSNQLLIIQAASHVVTDIAQGSPHSSRVNLQVTKHDVRTGEDFVLNSSYLSGATHEKAGVMTAEQVQSLTAAKTDISSLKAAIRTIRDGLAFADGVTISYVGTDRIGIQVLGYNVVTGEREVELGSFSLPAATTLTAGVMTAQHAKQLDALRQAVFGGSELPSVHSFYYFGIQIGMGKDELFLKGGEELVNLGLVPYLFRYSRKRNRTIDQDGLKDHGEIRKGWNVVGKGETIQIGNKGQVSINKSIFEHEEYDDQQMQALDKFQSQAKFFVADKLDESLGIRYVPFGKSKIDLHVRKDGEYHLRKVRLLYGIAFASYRTGKRELLDKKHLVTPIVPFHIANVPMYNGRYHWIFER